MSKCKEEFEKRFGSLSVWPHLWEDWQACWNVRGKVDAEICNRFDFCGNEILIAEAIEQEQCK